MSDTKKQERAAFVPPATLNRPTTMRQAFEAAGFRPKGRVGVSREPAWQVIRTKPNRRS